MAESLPNLFTSESVTSGHPDKVCDSISDAIVDECIKIDPNARIAVETLVKGTEDKSIIVLAGEVSLDGDAPDYEDFARKTAAVIGYTDHAIGMNANCKDPTSTGFCDVQLHITTQSPNIAQGIVGRGKGPETEAKVMDLISNNTEFSSHQVRLPKRGEPRFDLVITKDGQVTGYVEIAAQRPNGKFISNPTTLDQIREYSQSSIDILVAYVYSDGRVDLSKDTSKLVDLQQGAGDQGMMFGYACTETEAEEELRGRYFPLPAALSQRICRRLDMIVARGEIDWVRPDGKSQVTVEYDDAGNPLRVHTVVVAVQHDAALKDHFGGDIEAEQAHIHKVIKSEVVEHAIPDYWLSDDYILHVNGTGRFADPGGPYADAGITGRKIVVDAYGGMARHGGGAFSGKDPSKVDRSAAYGARWAAKHVVVAGLADRCEIQVAYVIGQAEPVSLRVDTFGTGVMGDSEISHRVMNTFDWRPAAIIRDLDLKRPIYLKTATGGHFGRPWTDDGHFPWERIHEKRIEALQVPETLTPASINEMTKEQLREQCKQRRIDTYPSMLKAELRRALEETTEPTSATLPSVGEKR